MASLLSSCSLSEWSKLHHQRLYVRLRQIANHDLADGNNSSARLHFGLAEKELEAANSGDDIFRQKRLLEIGRMDLLNGSPDAALQAYSQIRIQSLSGEAAAGKGFCYLARNQLGAARQQFNKALQCYRDNRYTPSIKPFPMDGCPDCCRWGLDLCDSGPDKVMSPAVIAGRPLPSACLANRLLFARTISFHKQGANQNQDKHASDEASRPGMNSTLQKSWTTLIEGGQAALNRRDFEKAERYFLSAIRLLQRNNDNSIRRMESLHCLTNLYTKWERRDKALPFFREEVQVKRMKLGPRDAGLIDPIRSYGLACLREGDLSNADEMLSEAKELCHANGQVDRICARLHSNLAELRIAQRRFRDAELEAQRSLMMLSKLNEHHEVRLAVPNFMMAKALIGQNRVDEVSEYMRRCQVAVTAPDDSEFIKLDIQLTRAELDNMRGKRPSEQVIREVRRLLQGLGRYQSTGTQKILLRFEARLKALECGPQRG